jgi:hypothetical protein
VGYKTYKNDAPRNKKEYMHKNGKIKINIVIELGGRKEDKLEL